MNQVRTSPVDLDKLRDEIIGGIAKEMNLSVDIVTKTLSWQYRDLRKAMKNNHNALRLTGMGYFISSGRKLKSKILTSERAITNVTNKMNKPSTTEAKKNTYIGMIEATQSNVFILKERLRLVEEEKLFREMKAKIN